MNLEDKSCIDCHNLRTKKVDGSFLVICKFNNIKRKFYETLDDIGKNVIDNATFKVQANRCIKYLLDI